MKANPEELTKFITENNRVFYVPVFQRRYDWDENHCEVLFKDIKETTDANLVDDNVAHFIGSIVYVEEKGNKSQPTKVILTDGQQRISTVLLFLAALRDVTTDNELKDEIKNKYLTVKLYKQKQQPYAKLKQVELDGTVFKSLMLNHPLNDEEKNTRIYRNYEYFVQELKKLQESDDEYDLSDLLYTGLDSFNLVAIELEPKNNAWENPQDIFETMNSLGKPLAFSDLIRNYLLLQEDYECQEDLYLNYWLPMEQKVKDDPASFIRDYMQMVAKKWFNQSKPENAKVLYSNFKNIFAKLKPEELLMDMNFYAAIYRWILQKDETKNTVVDRVLKDLLEIKSDSAHPMLLLLLGEWKKEKISDKEIETILLILRSYFLRRRIIKNTKGDNKTILSWLPIIEEEVLTADDKVQAFIELLGEQKTALSFPTDAKVKRALMEMDFFKSNYRMLILSMVEEAITKFRPVKDKYLQMEHIMPRTLNAKWQAELGPEADDIHNKLLNNIGNLTLIRHNQELGNKSFTDKKDIYANKAGMEISKQHIINCDTWGKDQIEARADWLSDLIIKEVVPYPKGLQEAIVRPSRKNFSFADYGLIGKTIQWQDNPEITATVVSAKQVRFEEKLWSLSGLTRELHKRKGDVRPSGSYNGYRHWLYNGVLLEKLSDRNSSHGQGQFVQDTIF